MSHRWKMYASFAAVYLIWGSTYLAIRVMLETLPPFLTAGVRFLLAGAILYVVARLRGAPAPTRAEWKSATVIGGLMLLIGNGAVVWAELRIPSGPAALIVATEPILVVIFQRVRPTGNLLVGLILGFLGMLVLVGPSALGGGEPIDPTAAIVVVFGSAAWAAGSLLARTAPAPKDALLSTAIRMLCGGALLWVAGMVRGELGAVNLQAISFASLAAVLYLMIFGSIVAFTAYSWLVANVAPDRVATYAFVNPVIAVLIGAALGHEHLSMRVGAAALVIVAGVVLITRPRPTIR